VSLLRADVLVLGAGPAGATAAMNLAGAHRVLLVERAAEVLPRIGESLPAAAGRLLGDMGLLDDFLRQGHARYHGNRSLWNGAFMEQHFMRDPDGPGWHLDRAGFDTWLRAEARRRGAALLAPAEVTGIEADEDAGAEAGNAACGPAGAAAVAAAAADARDAGWRVRLRTGRGEVEVRARIVIDAAGRGAPLARRLGARRQRLDRLACGWLYGRDEAGEAHGLAGVDRAGHGFSQVEACRDGWWYCAPLPGGRRVLAFHTDADLAPPSGLRDGAALLAAARALPGMGPLLAQSRFAPDGGAMATAAHSAQLEAAAGPGWLAAGDAAISFDPLSSQGIFNALYTGLCAAEAASRALQGDAAAYTGYSGEIASIGAAYRRHLAYCYGQERRWPAAPFWRRRHGEG